MKEEGHIREVIQVCIRFLSLYPDDVRLRRLLAESYAAVGFIGMAEAEFMKTGRMIDELVSVYRSLARIYETQGRHEEAAAALRRYVAHYPEQPEALESLGRLERALDESKALAETQVPVEDITWETESAEEELVDFATPTIAELYYAQGRTDAAIQTYESILKNHPEDGASLLRLKELRDMLNPPAKGDDTRPSPGRSKEERMIAILERWLSSIRELRYV